MIIFKSPFFSFSLFILMEENASLQDVVEKHKVKDTSKGKLQVLDTT